jgi:hypothetical protein
VGGIEQIATDLRLRHLGLVSVRDLHDGLEGLISDVAG